MVPLALTLGSALSLAALAIAQDSVCTRDFLKESAEAYIDAQTAGDASLMTLAAEVIFVENGESMDITEGLLSEAITIDNHRSLYDTTECAIYTEIIAATNTHPYVLGSQIRFDTDGAVMDMESVVTDDGDWLFDAAKTLEYALGETWNDIPEDERDTREVIQAAGDAYCDIFADASVVVPWGEPCARLEGGAYTGSGSATDRCDVGIPEGVNLVDRRYVIDEVMGTVDIMMRFAALPDTHEFRVEKGLLRYVHTMTVMDEGSGFP